MRPSSRPPLLVLALAALAALAACEPASSRMPGADEPPVGTQYYLRLRQGTMVSVVPGWPFGDVAAWGLVRLPWGSRHADLRAPGLAARAYLIWYDTTLGRVPPPNAPTTLDIEDTVGGSVVSSGGISVATTGDARGFSPPEALALTLHGRDSMVATLGDIHLVGVMRHDGSARGEWARRGADGRVLAHGRFDLDAIDAQLHGTMRANARDTASTRRPARPARPGRPVRDTVAR